MGGGGNGGDGFPLGYAGRTLTLGPGCCANATAGNSIRHARTARCFFMSNPVSRRASGSFVAHPWFTSVYFRPRGGTLEAAAYRNYPTMSNPHLLWKSLKPCKTVAVVESLFSRSHSNPRWRFA